jgi:lipoprotein-releasing system ATP-binding protein
MNNGGEAPAILAVELHKSYTAGDGSELQVLTGVDLEVRVGETVAIIGESGSGKSTLLHLLGGLDRPSSGEVRIGGKPVQKLNEEELGRMRNESVGFVFQFHHLLREFTVLENVMMPLLIRRVSKAEAADRARALIRDVGLEGRIQHKPMQLSGGEQQRVAVARALANQPLALLADEPSGNLDPSTSGRLHDLIFAVGAAHRTAMVLVTHNMQLASRADRILSVQNGKLVPATAEAYDYPE